MIKFNIEISQCTSEGNWEGTPYTKDYTTKEAIRKLHTKQFTLDSTEFRRDE